MKKFIIPLTIGLAVITVTAALYFKTDFPEDNDDKKPVSEPIIIEKNEKNEEEPLPETEPPKEETAPPSEDTQGEAIPGGASNLQSRLSQLVNTEYSAGGTVAICAGRVNETDLSMVNGGPMQAASLIKLYVADCVYENYKSVSSYDSYSGETEDLLRNMITVSDNTACNTLVTRLGNGAAKKGMSLVNQYCADHGFADTHMGRLMLQSNKEDDNYTSVRDCCNFLKMADSGKLKGSSQILNYMNQQERRWKIPSGIPSGVKVGNKTGELSDVENDAAIIYSNGGTYVLCVMSENLSDPYTAQQFISRTSGVVYEAMQ